MDKNGRKEHTDTNYKQNTHEDISIIHEILSSPLTGETPVVLPRV
jgi:hypothetical protein